jgi:hypothetical protein
VLRLHGHHAKNILNGKSKHEIVILKYKKLLTKYSFWRSAKLSLESAIRKVQKSKLELYGTHQILAYADDVKCFG